MMSTSLSFEQLPNIPQMVHFKKVATRLWERDGVVAIWLGGSIGTGKADRYSDVDLRLAVKPEALDQWQKPDWDGIFGRPNINNWSRPSEEDASLHHVLLDNAEMYDLWVQTPERELHQEPKLVIGCRDDELAQRLAEPSSEPRLEFDQVVSAKIQGAIEMYWSNHVKHEKVIHRNLTLMLRDGMYIFTGILLRLKFIQATGKDCGNVTFPPMTIHAITPVLSTLRDSYGNNMLAGMVPGDWSQAETVNAIDKLDDAIAEVGRSLAERYHFDYPDELQRVVLTSWQYFKEREGY
ncbi:MAG: nucleotidyltransferase domain-containing protein [Chloroflexota bacterium]